MQDKVLIFLVIFEIIFIAFIFNVFKTKKKNLFLFKRNFRIQKSCFKGEKK